MTKRAKRGTILVLIMTLVMPCSGCNRDDVQRIIGFVMGMFGGGGGGGGLPPIGPGGGLPPIGPGGGLPPNIGVPPGGSGFPPGGSGQPTPGGSNTPPASINPESIPPLVDVNVPFFKYEKQRENRKNHGPRFDDYETHCPRRFGTQYWDGDPLTHAHETTHGINSDIRNNYNKTGRRANGFYCGNDRGIVLVEPNIRKSHVCPYVPASMREFRYQTYLPGQTAWDDSPLYILDEYVAYTNGGEVGVELARNNALSSRCDGVKGALEFTVYSAALGMAVAARDPNYFQQYKPFRQFLKWQLARGMAVHMAGRNLPAFQGFNQDAYLQRLRSGQECENMRAFLKKAFGEDWFNKVIMGQ